MSENMVIKAPGEKGRAGKVIPLIEFQNFLFMFSSAVSGRVSKELNGVVADVRKQGKPKMAVFLSDQWCLETIGALSDQMDMLLTEVINAINDQEGKPNDLGL